MAPMATRNGAFSQENFQDFFEKWTAEQKQHLGELLSAITTPPPPGTTTSTPALALALNNDSAASGLVDLVIGHYEEYYRVKSHWVEKDVFVMLSPPWRTEFEAAFHWIGGWRPTMAFHLLYSKSGLQLESWLKQFWTCQGSITPADDLGGLTTTQLRLVNQLQKKTVEGERKISEKMAKHQETLADMEMVQLTHEVTELMGEGKDIREDDHKVEWDAHEQIESTLKPKEEGLKKILGIADELRLRTLKEVTYILSPSQALHFLIATAELHLRLHDWGRQRDDDKLKNDAHTNNY